MSQSSCEIKLSVIIPVYNAGATIGSLLESLQLQLTSAIEVICVDDGSKDDSALIIADYPSVRFHQRGRRGGVAACRNTGAKLTRGHYLIFLDADTRVRDPHLLAKFLDRFKNRQEYAAFSGFYHHDNKSCHLFGKFLDTYEHWLSLKAMNRDMLAAMAGAVCGIRKNIFEAVGGFDENPEIALEDDDLGYRLNQHGYRHLADGELLIEHRQPRLLPYIREMIPRTRYYVRSLKTYGLFNDMAGGREEGLSRAVTVLAMLSLPWVWTALGGRAMALFLGSLLILRWPFWIRLAGERGILFVPLGFVFYLLTSIPMILGGILGTFDMSRYMYRKIKADVIAFWGYLRSLLSRHSLGYTIFFVTHRCNANCIHCFDQAQRKTIHPTDELTITQIQQLAKSMRSAGHISLTGGEPFLRKELPEIVEAFYSKAGIRSFSILTNGSLPDQIETTLRRILAIAPHARFIVTMSVDAIGKRHDALRRLPGLFNNVEKTYHRLIKVRRQFPQLQFNAAITVFNHNKDTAIETILHLGQSNFDQVELIFVRGKPAEPTVKPIFGEDGQSIIEAVRKVNRLRSGKHSTLAGLFTALDRQVNDIACHNEPWPCGNCVAGQKLVVIRANGDVLPCEVIDSVQSEQLETYNNFLMGNLQDFKYDLSSLLGSPTATRIVKMIKNSKCHCSFECAITATLVYRPWNLPKLYFKSFQSRALGNKN